MTAEDTRRRRELARVTVIELVEQALKGREIDTVADVFSWLTGALEIDDDTTTRWRETLRAKRSTVTR